MTDAMFWEVWMSFEIARVFPADRYLIPLKRDVDLTISAMYNEFIPSSKITGESYVKTGERNYPALICLGS